MKSYRTNYTSREHTGTTVLTPNNNRGYLAIFPTIGSATVEFNGGGGLVPIAQGDSFEPYVAPIGTVEIVGGTYTVVS